MKCNSKTIALIKSFEGCKLTAYKLKGERNYTIGYGHSDANIKAGQTITQIEADNLLKSDLVKFENYVEKNACIKFDLNEYQFGALVSYCYNRGYKGLRELVSNSSTVSNLSDNIVKYWGSNTNYKTTLINRRKKERELFNYVENISRDTLVIPTPTLRRGSTGSQVNYLQSCLNRFGYGLVIDGCFGENTYKALCDFQYKNGLTIDGIYGRHSRDKLRGLLYGN